MNEKKPGILRYPKAGRAAAVMLAACMVLAGCATRRPGVDIWGDAGVAAEQRLVIEQQQRVIIEQRQLLEDMGSVLTEVHDGLGRAVGAVTASLGGNTDLQSQFREIDAFVRAVIANQRELEEQQRRFEEIQRADRGADAEAR